MKDKTIVVSISAKMSNVLYKYKYSIVRNKIQHNCITVWSCTWILITLLTHMDLQSLYYTEWLLLHHKLLLLGIHLLLCSECECSERHGLSLFTIHNANPALVANTALSFALYCFCHSTPLLIIKIHLINKWKTLYKCTRHERLCTKSWFSYTRCMHTHLTNHVHWLV